LSLKAKSKGSFVETFRGLPFLMKGFRAFHVSGFRHHDFEYYLALQLFLLSLAG